MDDSFNIVLTAAAMREADRRAIEEVGIPGRVLMETAGRAAADLAAELLGSVEGKHISVLCGKGNNGGDGLVMARVLASRGARTTVVALGDASSRSPEAQANLHALRASGLPATLNESASGDTWLEADLLVDALLGTGVDSAPREPIASLIGQINRSGRRVLALDIPTGLHSDSGRVLGEAVRASATLCMGAAKTGLFLEDGPEHAGSVRVAEIGIPEAFLRALAETPGSALLSRDAWIRDLLPRLPRQTHKFTTGPALVIGGSARYPGAPILASLAAGRAGAGYVQCAVPAGIADRVVSAAPEIPPLSLPQSPAGELHLESLTGDLKGLLARARSVLIGPGLGRGHGVAEFVGALLEGLDLPLVIDADGLRALAASGSIVAPQGSRRVLTPHEGEFAALGGSTEGYHSRILLATAHAAAWNSVLVLKGTPTIVAAPDGRAVIISGATPALGTAGTGDVLSGLIAGMLARGLETFEAAVCAAHIGTAAAHHYLLLNAAPSMMATDVLRHIGPVLRERFS